MVEVVKHIETTIDSNLKKLEQDIYDLGIDASPLSNFIDSKIFCDFNDLSKQGIISMLRTGLEKGSIKEVMDVIFNPQEPSQERLEIYKRRHREIYEQRAIELADMIIDGHETVILRSGMYGGKSTLATATEKELKKRGFTSSVLIAGILGDDFTTARAYEADEGVLPAEMVLPDTIENIKFKILEDRGDNENHVVYFDEFSFVDEGTVREIVNFCSEEGIKLIMAGLDADYLGRELPTMSRFRKECTHVEECFSFTMNMDYDSVENGEPIGTHTARYVRLPEGGYVLDVASLPLEVSKEKPYILYIPVAKQHHISGILEGHPVLEWINSYPEFIPQERMQRVFQFNLELPYQEVA